MSGGQPMRERPAGHLPETDRPARLKQQTADDRIWPFHGPDSWYLFRRRQVSLRTVKQLTLRRPARRRTPNWNHEGRSRGSARTPPGVGSPAARACLTARGRRACATRAGALRPSRTSRPALHSRPRGPPPTAVRDARSSRSPPPGGASSLSLPAIPRRSRCHRRA
jgi:hypothetical protein